MIDTNFQSPLISVIIPCYNHGEYLSQAIESVLNQSYSNIEIIVIDDGSLDDTPLVAKKYKTVIYHHQSNQGLSASRNKGMELSKGDYIVFLDADDWLVEDAISKNLQILQLTPKAAFVSGGHIFYYQAEDKQWDIIKEVESNHYQQMLMGNYIGMHATVMYQRWAVLQYPFDINLKNCEDYDQYFKILRNHPVIHHTKLIAVYRIHESNKSGNKPRQLETALQILKNQETLLQNSKEKECLETGIYWLKEYYCKKLYDNLVHRLYTMNDKIAHDEEEMLEKYRPELMKQYENELEIYSKFIANNPG